MAFTVAQLDAIKAAIASGELEVEYEGKRVKYRSMAELKDAKAIIEADLIATGQLSVPSQPRVSYIRRERA